MCAQFLIATLGRFYMSTISIDDLTEGGLNAPVHTVADIAKFRPEATPGASRYRCTLHTGEHVDALLLNKSSEVLVVTLHGATDRTKTVLPRFERVRTMNNYPVSGMWFADPALWRDEKLSLSWYTGWDGFDAQQLIADWSMLAAAEIGANRIIFTGASGGGFAALQISALVPGSLALAFNPQTSIYGYLADNQYWGPQKYYLKTVWPELAPDGIDAIDYSVDWTGQLDDRLSSLRRYSSPLDNHVLFIINRNEFHYAHHYLPWLGAAARGGNLSRIRATEYSGGTRHNPPSQEVFSSGLQAALSWAAELPKLHVSLHGQFAT